MMPSSGRRSPREHGILLSMRPTGRSSWSRTPNQSITDHRGRVIVWPHALLLAGRRAGGWKGVCQLEVAVLYTAAWRIADSTNAACLKPEHSHHANQPRKRVDHECRIREPAGYQRHVGEVRHA